MNCRQSTVVTSQCLNSQPDSAGIGRYSTAAVDDAPSPSDDDAVSADCDSADSLSTSGAFDDDDDDAAAAAAAAARARREQNSKKKRRAGVF